MKRVDFNVRHDWEYVHNYKELQRAFNKVKVDRGFNVNQLSKGKRQDSIEFMQWFKGYWDSVAGGEDVGGEYDAVGRRQSCKTGDWKKFSTGVGMGKAGAVAQRMHHGNVGRGDGACQPRVGSSAVSKECGGVGRVGGEKAAGGIKAVTVDPQVEAKMQALSDEVTELKLQVDTAERERDFYFDKLRDIEILCQAPELGDIPVLRVVEKVLYAVDSEEAKQVMVEAQKELGAQLLLESASQPEEDSGAIEEAADIAPIAHAAQ